MPAVTLAKGRFLQVRDLMTNGANQPVWAFWLKSLRSVNVQADNFGFEVDVAIYEACSWLNPPRPDKAQLQFLVRQNGADALKYLFYKFFVTHNHRRDFQTKKQNGYLVSRFVFCSLPAR